MRLVELQGENGRIRFHPRLTLVTLDDDTGESFARRLSNALTSPGGEHLVIEIDGTLTDASQLPHQLLELGETLILGEADLLKALGSIGTDLERKALEQRTELVESLAVLRERASREISQRDALFASIADVNRRVEDLRGVLARCEARVDQAPLSAVDPETLRRARAADRDQLEAELAALAETLEAAKEALDEAVRSGHYVSALDAAELARLGSTIKLFEREVESNDDPELLAVLEAKREAEHALLESLGFESKMDYLLYVTTHSADPDVESRRADARRRFEDAWRAHDELREFCELVGRLGDLGLLVPDGDDELPSVEEVHRDLDLCETQKADLGSEVQAHNERLAKLDHLCASVEAKLQRLAGELALWENPSLENLRSEHVEMVLRAALEVHPWIEELGPLPILIEDAFTQLNADVRREMLDLVAQLSEDVQVVIVSNNAAVVAMVRRQGKEATTIAPKLRRPGRVVAKRWPNAPGADASQVEDLKGAALASTRSTGPSTTGRSASRIGLQKRLGLGGESAQPSEEESTETVLDANPTAAAPIFVSDDLQRQALEVAQEALGKARRAAEARRSADFKARSAQVEEKRIAAEEAKRRREEEKRRREEEKRRRAEAKRAALAAQREEAAATRRRIAEQRAVKVVNSQVQHRRPTQPRGSHPDPLRRGAPPDQRVATGREKAMRDRATREKALREKALREKALREQAVREEALRQRVEREELERERKRQEKMDKAERSAAQREARAEAKRHGDETARAEQARRDEASRLAREEEARLERRARAQAAAAAARLAVQTAAAEAAAREAAEAAVLAGQAAEPEVIQPDAGTPGDNLEASPSTQRLGSAQQDQDGEVRPSWERMNPEPASRERCRSHSFTGAVGHCSQCELPFCEECLVELGRKDSQLTCVNCALVLAGVRRRGKNRG